jgi:hypothetical protein
VRDAKPLDCPKPGRDKKIQAELWDATAAVGWAPGGFTLWRQVSLAGLDRWVKTGTV